MKYFTVCGEKASLFHVYSEVAVTVNGFLIMQMQVLKDNQDKDCPHKLLCDV